jgi:hypothetical protein
MTARSTTENATGARALVCLRGRGTRLHTARVVVCLPGSCRSHSTCSRKQREGGISQLWRHAKTEHGAAGRKCSNFGCRWHQASEWRRGHLSLAALRADGTGFSVSSPRTTRAVARWRSRGQGAEDSVAVVESPHARAGGWSSTGSRWTAMGRWRDLARVVVAQCPRRSFIDGRRFHRRTASGAAGCRLAVTTSARGVVLAWAGRWPAPRGRRPTGRR